MLDLMGVANSNPFTFTQDLRQWLEDADVNPKGFKPTLLGFGEWPEDVSGVVLVPTVSLLTRRLPLLEDANAVVVCFDTAVLLEYLTPLHMLDVLPKTQSFRYVFKPIDGFEVIRRIQQAKAQRQHVEVSKKEVDLIPTLLGETQGSVLAPMLTYLYSVKDTNLRHEYQLKILHWMRDGLDLEEELPESRARDRLLEHLQSDVAVATLAAVREMVSKRKAGKTVNLEKLATSHKINVFDLKWVVHQFQKADIQIKAA